MPPRTVSFPALHSTWPSERAVLVACSRAAKNAGYPGTTYSLKANVVHCAKKKPSAMTQGECGKEVMRLKAVESGWVVSSRLEEDVIVAHLQRDANANDSLLLRCDTGSVTVRAGDDLFGFNEFKLLERMLQDHALKTGRGLSMTLGALNVAECRTRISFSCRQGAASCSFGICVVWDWDDDPLFHIERLEMGHSCGGEDQVAHEPLVHLKWTEPAEDLLLERLPVPRSPSLDSSLSSLSSHASERHVEDAEEEDDILILPRKLSHASSSSSPDTPQSDTPPTSNNTPPSSPLLTEANKKRRVVATSSLIVPVQGKKRKARSRALAEDDNDTAEKGYRTRSWVRAQAQEQARHGSAGSPKPKKRTRRR